MVAACSILGMWWKLATAAAYDDILQEFSARGVWQHQYCTGTGLRGRWAGLVLSRDDETREGCVEARASRLLHHPPLPPPQVEPGLAFHYLGFAEYQYGMGQIGCCAIYIVYSLEVVSVSPGMRSPGLVASCFSLYYRSSRKAELVWDSSADSIVLGWS